MPWRAATVTTTTQEIAGYSPSRKSLSLFHNGTDNIVISQDPSNVATQGFVLAPGISVTLVKEEGDEPERELYAVSLLGNQNIRVEESVGAVA